jgi:hypothetical protein
MSLARKWIEDCRENHTKCSKSRSTVDRNWNPTRLVEIDKEGNCSRLCEGSQIGAPVKYATLSHCWGEIRDKVVLTEQNKAAFQDALPGTCLPQTFKDALTAVGMLGFRYIWIDSLCIIQDSRDDWLKESSQMGKIYEYSTLTITATSSKDDNEGLFFNRDPRDTFPVRVSLAPRSGWEKPGKGSKAPQIVFDLNCPAMVHWNNDVEHAPINQRGWVLQEVNRLVPFYSDVMLITSTSVFFHQEFFTSANISCTGNAVKFLRQNRIQGVFLPFNPSIFIALRPNPQENQLR